MRIKHEQLLPGSPSQVAEVLNSAGDAPRWQDGLVEMEIVSGGPNQVGSIARLHYEEGGRNYVMQDELLECEPEKRWRSRVSGNGMTIFVETMLQRREEETLMRMTWSGRPNALLHRLLFPLVRPAVKRHIRADLESLARLLAEKTGGGSFD